MKRTALIFCALAAIALLAPAQTTTGSSAAGFTASSEALGINCSGWNVGNRTDEFYDTIDFGSTKSNRIFLDGMELTAPSCGGGFSVFGGGIIFQPDLSALLAKTNLSSGNLIFSLNGIVGNAIPSTGSDRVSLTAGGQLKYILSDNLTWDTVSAGVVTFGSSRYPYVSSGLTAFFTGTPASAAVSSNVAKALAHRVASLTAKLAAAQKK